MRHTPSQQWETGARGYTCVFTRSLPNWIPLKPETVGATKHLTHKPFPSIKYTRTLYCTQLTYPKYCIHWLGDIFIVIKLCNYDTTVLMLSLHSFSYISILLLYTGKYFRQNLFLLQLK